MKKITKINLMVLMIFICLVFFSSVSNAASFDASITKTNATVGDSIAVTVTADNAAGMYSVTASNSKVSVTSGETSEFLEDGSTTITFKAESAGTVTITATATDMTDLDDDEKKVTGSKSFEITIKEKNVVSDKNEEKPSNNEENKQETETVTAPTFTKTNKKVYAKKEINLRSSWSTSSQATTIDGGTELTLTGTSTERIDGYIWYRVTYKGETKYVASTLITTEKPEEEEEEKSDNNSLKSLKVTPSELTPNFDSETENYELTIGSNIDKVEVKATPEDDKAKVKVSGNEDLEIGENTIRIVVTAEDGTERVYKIVVTKEDEKQLGLKELLIENVSLSPKFEENVYSYTAELEDTEIKELNITATATRKEAEVEIVGNTDLKVGENTITIMVKADDGEIVTYQIKVTIKDPSAETNASVVEENNGSNDLKKYVVIAAAVLIVIAIVVIIISKNEEADEETEIEPLTDEDLPKSLRKNKKEQSSDKEIELPVEKDLKDKIDELMSEETDNEEKRTTRKGKRFK